MKKNIYLKNNLIAIGGYKDAGKTAFALQLANRIAENEKVLYLSWQDYGANLQSQILQFSNKIADNLDINTQVDYYSVRSFIQILELIEEKGYTTLFIDDVDSFKYGTISNSYYDYENNAIIETLKYIAEKYTIRLIFTLRIPESEDLTISLRDFAWSRLIVNDCEQVISIYKNTELEENCIYLSYLKGKDLEIQNEIINLKNIDYVHKRI